MKIADVNFSNRTLKRLYVAIGVPGVIDVFDTEEMIRPETVRTEVGAHTSASTPSETRSMLF